MAESNELIAYEKRVLYFLLKDIDFVEDLFENRGVSPRTFSHSTTQRLALEIKKNYEKYRTVLVEGELVNILNESFDNKEITDLEYKATVSLFSELTDPEEFELEDEQFIRICSSWISLESVSHIKDAFKKSLKLLDEGKGMEAASDIVEKITSLKVFDTAQDKVTAFDLINDTSPQYEDAYNRREFHEKYRGIPTGIDKLDEFHNGFEKGTLTLIGGLPGSGKSTLAMNISRNILERSDKKVLIISMEMSEEQWCRKYNSLDMRLDSSALLRGDKDKISEKDMDTFKARLEERKTKKREGGYKILAMASQSKSWDQITSLIKKKFKDWVPDIIFVDQLSLIHLGKYSKLRLPDALGFLSKDIRAYAQEMDIPIVTMVQANRGAIKSTGKDNTREVSIDIENIEDSNKIGADADCFLAIHPADGDFKVSVKIVKQREGAKETVTLRALLDVCAIFDDESEWARGFKDMSMSEEEAASLKTDTKINELDELNEVLGCEITSESEEVKNTSKNSEEHPEDFDSMFDSAEPSDDMLEIMSEEEMPDSDNPDFNKMVKKEKKEEAKMKSVEKSPKDYQNLSDFLLNNVSNKRKNDLGLDNWSAR